MTDDPSIDPGNTSRGDPAASGANSVDDPVNHQRIRRALTNLRARGELPRVFAVVTWGCTATNWFAKTLNSHPEILCLHIARPKLKLISPTMDQVDDADLLTVLRILGMGYSLAGDVHGVSRSSIQSLQTVFGDEFRAAGMIREPLERLRSQFALFESDAFDTTRSGDLSYVKTLFGYESIRSLVGDDPEKTCFVHSANMLNAIIEESEILPRFFRHEDITSDAAELIAAVHYLSAGTAKADEEFAARALQSSAINRHRRAGQDVSFNGWKIEVIKSIVRPEAWRLYRNFGYDTPDFVSLD